AILFAIFVLLGELLPITVPRQSEEDQITTSTTFSLALLITTGVLPAIVAQASASVVADLLRRKPAWKAGFNAAQYALSLFAAAVVLSLLSSGSVTSAHPLAAGTLPAIFAAGAVFFLANTTLTGTALALAQKVAVGQYLRRDLL